VPIDNLLTNAETQHRFSRKAQSSLGQPIGRMMARALQFPDLISLAAGFVDNATLPIQEVAECTQRLLADSRLLRQSLQYDSTAGNLLFRDNLAAWNYRDYPSARPSAERVIVGAGSNQLLHLISEALLDPGDIVLAAAPTYFVFMGTLRALGVRVVGVPADSDGICIDSLVEQLESLTESGLAPKVKAIYLVTDFDNPAGSTLSLKRRMKLLEIVNQWRFRHGPLYVLSDNAYQHLRYEGQPIAPMLALTDDAKDSVIELGTFSKSFSPGIRVGWGVVPSSMVDHVLDLKSSIDFGSPHFNQVLMNEVITSGSWDRHLPTVLAGYQLKLKATLDALDRFASDLSGVSWRHPQGGLYVWLTLPEEMDASEQGPLWEAATHQGVLYVPGHYCYPSVGEPIHTNTIRLSFGVLSEEKLTEGIQRLCEAIRSLVQ
jgi:2-aminoadipate transaminase